MAQPTSKSKGKLTLGKGNSSNNRASSSRPSSSSSSIKRGAPPSAPYDSDEDEEEDSDADAPMSEPDTDDEIAAAKATKSKKTAKRKRRAVDPSSFGATLQGLLGDAGASLDASDDDDEEDDDDDDDDKIEDSTSATTSKRIKPTPTSTQPTQSAILSLAPHIRRAAQSSRLNEKASRLAVQARKEREERARVKDVIGGWGKPGELPNSSSLAADSTKGTSGSMEKERSAREDKVDREWQEGGGAQGYERKLRKVAQRGVVKLFNAIRAAQNTTEEDVERAELEERETAAAAGTGAKGGAAQGASTTKGKNVLGGKEKAVKDLSKANFLQLIKSSAQSAASARS